MKFSIPCPCDELDLKLLEKYDKVREVYFNGPSDIIGTGRIFHYEFSSVSDAKRKCKEIHDRDCEVNVLLNATCFGGEEYTRKWLRKTLEYLDCLSSMDIDCITIANPYLVALVRHYGFSFKVVVSVLAFIKTPLKARYFDEMGVDRITLATDINRDLTTIKQIRKAAKCDLGIIVNEGCLLNCPSREPFCHNYVTHASANRKLSLISRNFPPYYWFNEFLIRITKPYTMLTSPWVRPENLGDYEKLGITVFKISGRDKPCSFLQKCLEAYHSRHFDGNIFEIMDGTLRVPDAWSKRSTGYKHYGPPFYYLDNKELDVFFEKVKNCAKNCQECEYCEEFAKRHLSENKEVSEEIRKLFRTTGYTWPPFSTEQSLVNRLLRH